MSYVTGLILQCSVAEDHIDGDEDMPLAVAALNEWLDGYDKTPLRDSSDAVSGPKHPQFHLFTMGYNYFPAAEFAVEFKRAKWLYPEQAVLTMTTEEEPTQIYRADDE